ncbi:MAG: 3-deoxy-manno-octulosonate cytidylyltransferase [Bacteroides sp.]|nr:3-deoxy-manno-octulosonate cytidylyltransferase [Bacteroides sp.]
MKPSFIGIIPARYASTRFPGKPLAKIGGVPMIQRVVERARMALDRVIVATDDVRIADCVAAFGGEAVMTSESHRSGTDRCREAYEASGSDADVVINVQGDEPFIEPAQIEALKGCFEADPDVELATLVRRFDPALGWDALFNANTPKVVRDERGNAVWFSRSIIPYVRNYPWQEWIDHAEFFTHVGMYGYRADTLAAITQLPQSPAEIAESLEQLRWLQNGYQIRSAVTDLPTIGIDTPDDLHRAEEMLLNR